MLHRPDAVSHDAIAMPAPDPIGVDADLPNAFVTHGREIDWVLAA